MMNNVQVRRWMTNGWIVNRLMGREIMDGWTDGWMIDGWEDE